LVIPAASKERIMKAEMSGFLKYLDAGVQDLKSLQVIVLLIRRLKRESGEWYHMKVMACVRMSGVMAGRWADRVGKSLVRKRWRNGFCFIDTKGNQAKIGIFDDVHQETYVYQDVEASFV
jgi:hypothetical protein